MRTIETIIEIPARAASQTTVKDYGCDECDFVSRDQREVEAHFAKTHAVKDRFTAGEHTVLRFETEEAAKAWVWADDGSNVARVKWEGPGWYVPEWGSEPCARGCCTDTVCRLVPAADFAYDLQQEGRDKLRAYFRIREQLRRRTPCSGSTS